MPVELGAGIIVSGIKALVKKYTETNTAIGLLGQAEKALKDAEDELAVIMADPSRVQAIADLTDYSRLQALSNWAL